MDNLDNHPKPSPPEEEDGLEKAEESPDLARALEVGLDTEKGPVPPPQKGKNMTEKIVLGGRPDPEKQRREQPESLENTGKSLAGVSGWVGWALLAAGGSDIFLTWYPTRFGDPQWEFGTVSASFNGMPIILLGLLLLLVGGTLLGRRWWTGAGALISGLFLALVLYGIVLYWTTAPLALGSLEGIALTGLKKAVTKTAVQSLVYPVLLAFVLRRFIGATRRRIPQD